MRCNTGPQFHTGFLNLSFISQSQVQIAKWAMEMLLDGKATSPETGLVSSVMKWSTSLLLAHSSLTKRDTNGDEKVVDW